jgi:hypothetical protein
MKLYSRYSWLCLCLFFLLVTVSCASRRAYTGQVPTTVKNVNVTYQLAVKLQVDGSSDDLPGEYAAFLVQPLNVMYSRDYLVFRPKTLQFYFRFPDINLMQQCRDCLLSSGKVIQISAIKH